MERRRGNGRRAGILERRCDHRPLAGFQNTIAIAFRGVVDRVTAVDQGPGRGGCGGDLRGLEARRAGEDLQVLAINQADVGEACYAEGIRQGQDADTLPLQQKYPRVAHRAAPRGCHGHL